MATVIAIDAMAMNTITRAGGITGPIGNQALAFTWECDIGKYPAAVSLGGPFRFCPSYIAETTISQFDSLFQA